MSARLNKKSRSANSHKKSDLTIKKQKVHGKGGQSVTIIKLEPPKSSHSHQSRSNGSLKAFGIEPGFKIAKRFDEKLIQKREWMPVEEDTHWKCIRCGWCCTENCRVNLTWKEYDRLKEKMPITEIVLDKEKGISHPFFKIRDKCVCYDPNANKCKIHPEWPYSCATFPFALTPDGVLIRSKLCNGFGNGKKINPDKMIKYILKCRKRAGIKTG